MVSNGASRRFATPRRHLITAYLRVLGSRRKGPDGLECLRDEVEPRLRGVVAEALGVEPEQLECDISLQDDLAADSLDLLDVLARVEETFDVVVPEREMAVMRTYGDLTAVITALVACRLRAREDVAGSGQLELRIGAGVVPRFLRVLGSGAYDQEVVRDDLRSARAGEAVALRGGGGSPPASTLERMFVQAGLAGAEVTTADAGHPGCEPAPENGDDVRAWPASRLVSTSIGLAGDLVAERDASLASLGAPSRAAAARRAKRRAATNDRVATFRAVVETYLDVIVDSRTDLHAAARELGRLDLVRRAADERAMDATETGEAYDSIRAALLAYVHALRPRVVETPARLPPRGIARRAESSDRVDHEVARA